MVVKVDTVFSTICGANDTLFEARLLAPLKADDEEEEETISKNDSSVVVRVDLKAPKVTKTRYQVGCDAGVAIWEKLWERNKDHAERWNPDRSPSPLLAWPVLRQLVGKGRKGEGQPGGPQCVRPGAGCRVSRVQQQDGGGRRR
jgi:hypothetical protein